MITSGAIAAGWERLGFPPRERTVTFKQMLAAVGQSSPMHRYEQLFAIYGATVAKALLTRDDLGDRRRYLNARNTLGGTAPAQVRAQLARHHERLAA